MLALPDIQARVMDALLRRDGTAATALVRPTASLSALKRLQVYRNNMVESLIAALGAVYPVVARLVGNGFFRHAAKAFISAHPSRSGNLQDFGGEIPAFLRAYPPAADLPYLPDVAALEWALHRAYHEIELPALTLERLAQVPVAGQAGLRLRLQPSARFVASRYPLLRIWQSNQPEALDDESTISLDEGGVDLLVVQRALELEFRLLGVAEGRWLRALADEASLAEATRRAMDIDPAFDLMGALARHLGLGLFTEAST
ncbi:DNA-binding domain-containing protein [Variovorax sp. YR216]|uniref:HvfC/BufC N-terminal domain-containing protein n=1 Tax=Variovorax sp. YR216 TaxID=1882828 RepID=UPI00089D87AA|nr:DNA-binding domain-containing protein [Variovorax sp. YR216]SEB25477.1 Putative DNA-binding domain-containing protein [Variovorax sp. YR216]